MALEEGNFMDWLNRAIEQFEHMPTERAALMLLFVGLMILVLLLIVVLQRGQSEAANDKGQTASVLSLANTIDKLTATFNGMTESMKQQEERNQLRFEESLKANQGWFDNSLKIMMDVRENRDAKVEEILTGISGVPGRVEVEMQPKFNSLEKFVTDRLDEFEQRLTKKIEDLPQSIFAALKTAVSEVKQEIVKEIKGDYDGQSVESGRVEVAAHGDSAGGGNRAGAGDQRTENTDGAAASGSGLAAVQDQGAASGGPAV
jgi:hypothetical protein